MINNGLLINNWLAANLLFVSEGIISDLYKVFCEIMNMYTCMISDGLLIYQLTSWLLEEMST